MNTTSAFLALVGRPNVGKSTLLNALIGEKVSIVSSKPQTTRNRITGVLTLDETQLVFLDTPGWHTPQSRLGDFMVGEVKNSLAGIDAAIFVTTAAGDLRPEEESLLKNIQLREIPIIAVLNKIDLLKQKDLMFPKIQHLSEAYGIQEILPLSAQTGEGVSLVLETAKKYAKPSPHYFDPEHYTDQPERVLVAEMIREKLLRNLRDELPHGIAIGVERMEERENSPIMDIEATIFCERSSHKGMIIGKQGQMLKKIGSQARQELEAFLDCKVNLQLWVKVKEDWRNRENLLRQLGFD